MSVADPRGAQQACAPLKLDHLCFLIQFFIRMLKKIRLRLHERALKQPQSFLRARGPWTPAESEFGSALVMCVLAHNLLRPPPPKMKILHGSATECFTVLCGNDNGRMF